MNALLIAAALALGAGEAPAGKAATAMNGKWLIVYAEEGGRRNNAWEARQATIADGVLSYESGAGAKRSLMLSPGPGQTLQTSVPGAKGGGMRGVYILGQDYLCISLKKTGAKKKGAPAGAGAAIDGAPATAAVGGGAAMSSSSGDFILILRRQRGKTPRVPPAP